MACDFRRCIPSLLRSSAMESWCGFRAAVHRVFRAGVALCQRQETAARLWGFWWCGVAPVEQGDPLWIFSRPACSHNIELDSLTFSGGHHAQQSSYGIGNLPVLANNAAHILLGNMQFQYCLAALVSDIHPHFIGMVHQGTNDVLNH